MFKPLNIKDELRRVRDLNKANENSILHEARALLEAGKKADEEVMNRLGGSDGDGEDEGEGEGEGKGERRALDLGMLLEEDIYSIDEIKAICIRYRLRFLNTKYFRREFPYEAVQKIKALETLSGVKIEKFRIIAPGEAFNLEDANKDPMLFTELADGRYYLLHKWGKDLSWSRKVLTWPLQDLQSFFITLAAFCALLAFSLPKEWIVRSESLYDHLFQFRMLFMVQSFIGLFFFIVFLGLAFHKNFSSMDWNSRNFN